MSSLHSGLLFLTCALLMAACEILPPPPPPPEPGSCEAKLPCSLIPVAAPGVAPRDMNTAMATVQCRTEQGLAIHEAFDSDILDVDPVATLGIGPASRVLDVGAGTGVLGFLLLERGVPFTRYIAQDIDLPSLDFMQRALEEAGLEGGDKVEVVVGSRRSVRVEPKAADVAVLNSVRFAMRRFDEGEGTPPKQDVGGLISSLVDAVEPGGVIHVIEPVEDVGGKTYPEAWVREPFEHPRLELITAEIINPRGAANYHHAYRVLESGPAPEHGAP
jgi:SAM-dependent methyltransferase